MNLYYNRQYLNLKEIYFKHKLFKIDRQKSIYFFVQIAINLYLLKKEAIAIDSK